MISVNLAETTRLRDLQGLIPDIDKKIQKALRASIRQAKSDAVKSVAERFTIKKSKVRETLRTRISGEVAELKSEAYKRNELSDFKVNPKGRIRSRGKYKRVEIKRGESRVRKRIWSMTKNQYLYERKGKERVPFRRKKGPSTPEMLSESQVSQKIIRLMEQRFKENFV